MWDVRLRDFHSSSFCLKWWPDFLMFEIWLAYQFDDLGSLVKVRLQGLGVHVSGGYRIQFMFVEFVPTIFNNCSDFRVADTTPRRV